MKYRLPVWRRYVLFDPDDFQNICDDILVSWRKPRVGVQERPRKHGVGGCLFAVLGALTTGLSDIAMEGVVEMPASLINIEFERILKILDETYECELFLMNEEEKRDCVGAAKSHPNIMYFVDGCDFAINNAKEGWMYKTHKKNVPKQRAIRAQILIDAGSGFFRGVEVDPAGLYNDQAMLSKSKWNRPNKLTNDDEYVGADLGYASTQYINVMKPFSNKDLKEIPDLKLWNKFFNADRSLIERNLAVIRSVFRIFDAPWRRNKHLFPLALRVCLKLLNKYWRLPQNLPPGLKRRYRL